ncbi:hypothetical protein YC2023_060406 [Brassica napus]
MKPSRNASLQPVAPMDNLTSEVPPMREAVPTGGIKPFVVHVYGGTEPRWVQSLMAARCLMEARSLGRGTWPEQMVDLSICWSEHDGSRINNSAWKPEAGGRDPDPREGTQTRGQEPGTWRQELGSRLRELRRSIKFLVEFGVGRQLDETLPPWWGLVGVGRRFDGESSSVCIKGDASAHTPDAYAAPECMGQDPRILRGRILARLRIRGMRRFNKTRRPKLRILMLDPAGLACAS